MKNAWSFALVLALGVGLQGAIANAQNTQPFGSTSARGEYVTTDRGQNPLLRLADWDDHRRCDGDHDRDDRGCHYRDRDRYYTYGNAYAAPYYYHAPNAGWYDRYGYWHAYDRDRDRDRRRHDDDDRR